MPFSNRKSLEISSALKRLNLESTETGRERLMDEMMEGRGPRIVNFMNAHTFNMAWKHASVRLDIHESNWLLRDGIGMSMMLRFAGRQPGLNLNGTDFIPDLLARHAGRKIVFAGSSSPWIERATMIARERFQVDVVEVMDGFQEDSRYLEMLDRSHADLIVLAMGTPKQERIAKLIKTRLDRNILIVCGGGVLDFMAGKVSRAPAWVRKAGMEWLFRMMQEFPRLWHRYLIGNPLFILRAIWTCLFFQKHLETHRTPLNIEASPDAAPPKQRRIGTRPLAATPQPVGGESQQKGCRT